LGEFDHAGRDSWQKATRRAGSIFERESNGSRVRVGEAVMDGITKPVIGEDGFRNRVWRHLIV
jgi:hypothetical protein